ncbi:hypothetical protein IV203_026803 [Nitzschia inconspicua]|uniref:Uncharacterized protein n=1 Tax=Nitzschia inconspicua TaxID=303405 RepID=A0A9K3LJW7_9STRA|nr:hypothetical protein IV203_026803 [Nitzschia inconspicua]
MAKKKKSNNNKKKNNHTNDDSKLQEQSSVEESPLSEDDVLAEDSAAAPLSSPEEKLVDHLVVHSPEPSPIESLAAESLVESSASVEVADNATPEAEATTTMVADSNNVDNTEVSPGENSITDVPEKTSVEIKTETSDDGGLILEEKLNVEAVIEHERLITPPEEDNLQEVINDGTRPAENEAKDEAEKEARTINGAPEETIQLEIMEKECSAAEVPAEVEGEEKPKSTPEEEEEAKVDAEDFASSELVEMVRSEREEPENTDKAKSETDDVKLIERGIDDSPSDELGPPLQVEDEISETTPVIEDPLATKTKDPSPATENNLGVDSKIVTEPTVASTAAPDNGSVHREPVQETSSTQAKKVDFTKVEEKKNIAKPQDPAPTLTFAQAFGNPDSKPPPIQTDLKDKDSSSNPTPRGMTFAQAFGSNPISPLATPASASKDASSAGTQVVEPPPSTKSTASSHSALSASRNKKVQGLMSKYMEEVAHEPLPGDAIPIRKKNTGQSPANSLTYASQDTPLSAQSIREKIAVTEVELAHLPNIASVRDKFESSSRSTGSDQVFEFGESFRQKKRFEQLSEKERQQEAKVVMRGFNERDLFPGKVASGEIDSSSLGKVYTFEMSTNASMDLPPDGTCRVNYQKADYSAMVFVVHRTRGMLLLHAGDGTDKKRHVPTGVIQESEFLDAAKKSGSGNAQLQIAAREAAARQLFENTGLDIRHSMNRFKPAILRLNPPTDAKGVQYLKNEYNNRLYYFLQVDEEDFATISEADGNGKLTRPSEDSGDSPLVLRLRDTYDGFTFVLDPSDAAKILKQDGNIDATSALRMIMNEASGGTSVRVPDVKAADYSVADSAPDDEKADRLASATVRTVGEKTPDTHDHTEGVTCCCGWW